MSRHEIKRRIESLDEQVSNDLIALSIHDRVPIKIGAWSTKRRAVLLCALALTGGYLVGSQFDNGHIKLHRVLAPLIASPSLIG